MHVQTIHHDSPLGRWTLTLAAAPDDLREVIGGFWNVEGRTTHLRERVLPGGELALMFNLGPVQGLVGRDGAPDQRFRASWISGLQQQYLVTESPNGSHLVGMMLRPLGAWRLFGFPLDALTNRVLELDQVLNAEATSCRDRLGETVDISGRFDLLAEFARRRIARAKDASPQIVDALARITRSQGQIRIDDVRRHVGWSERHFADEFRRQVGLAPKAYARILRFSQAIGELQRSDRVDGSALAQTCGYYDQAHLIRDFHAFAGAAPGDFLRSRVPGGPGPGFARDD